MRSIDAAARRANLAEAVWRLIRRDRLGAASVRAVAAEAGLSTGSVRHFFPSQTELHVFAMESLAERITQRVAAHEHLEDLRARVDAMVGELLPSTDESGTWSLVGLELEAPVLTEDARTADFTNETELGATPEALLNAENKGLDMEMPGGAFW